MELAWATQCICLSSADLVVLAMLPSATALQLLRLLVLLLLMVLMQSVLPLHMGLHLRQLQVAR